MIYLYAHSGNKINKNGFTLFMTDCMHGIKTRIFYAYVSALRVCTRKEIRC